MKRKNKVILISGGILSLIIVVIAISFLYNEESPSEKITSVEKKHYRKEGQPPREWNREIYYEDMDSITVSRWNSLSKKEKIEAVEKAFIFECDSNEWKKYSEEEHYRALFCNTFIEWD